MRWVKSSIEYCGKHPFATGLFALLGVFGLILSIVGFSIDRTESELASKNQQQIVSIVEELRDREASGSNTVQFGERFRELSDLKGVTFEGAFAGHTNIITKVIFIHGGRQIVSAGWDGTVRVWSVESGRQISTFSIQSSGPTGLDGLVLDIAANPQNNDIAACYRNGVLRLWNIEKGTLSASTQVSPARNCNKVKYSPDGSLLATSSSDGKVKTWKSESLEFIAEYGRHGVPVEGFDFSDDGDLIASGAEDGVLHVWKSRNGSTIRRINLERGPIRTVSVDGERVTASHDSENSAVSVWSLQSGTIMRDYAPRSEKKLLHSARAKTGNHKIVTVYADMISIFDRFGDVAEIQAEIDHYESSPFCQNCFGAVNFSPDGSKLAVVRESPSRIEIFKIPD